MAGQPGESNNWAIDMLGFFIVGKVRCLTQSRWWSTTSCLFGKEDMAFSWLIVLREELVLPLFLGATREHADVQEVCTVDCHCSEDN